MSFPSCPSPPPPLPSPVLVPAPLPSPPPLARKHSPRRASDQGHPSASPPIFCKTLAHAFSHDALHRASRTPRIHTDHARRPSSRTIKRTLSHLPSRCRSPPPSPAVRSPTPPVPPIPAFVLSTNHSFIRPSLPNRVSPFDLYLDHPFEDLARMRCEPHSGTSLTCMQFFAIHNAKGQCRA